MNLKELKSAYVDWDKLDAGISGAAARLEKFELRDYQKEALLVGRFKGITDPKTISELLLDGTHEPAAGKFLHVHYTAHEMRLHCWIWKDI